MKKSVGDHVFEVANTLFCLIMIVLTLYPIVYVALASVSDSNRLLAHTGILLYPLGFNLDAYLEVLKNPMVSSGFLNSVFYVITGTAVNMAVTIMGAFALSRKRLWIRKYINLAVVFTMFFSGGLVPMFLLVRNLGLYDSRLALILPTTISTYNLIVMRTSFQAFPDSLEEAAKMDGANDFLILLRIVVPLSGATIAVITLFYGVTHWNDWFQAAIFSGGNLFEITGEISDSALFKRGAHYVQHGFYDAVRIYGSGCACHQRVHQICDSNGIHTADINRVPIFAKVFC